MLILITPAIYPTCAGWVTRGTFTRHSPLAISARVQLADSQHVSRIDAFSGHAGRSELIGYVKSLSGSLRKITVIHGEECASLAFGQALQVLKPQAEVVVPQPGQILEF